MNPALIAALVDAAIELTKVTVSTIHTLKQTDVLSEADAQALFKRLEDALSSDAYKIEPDPTKEEIDNAGK